VNRLRHGRVGGARSKLGAEAPAVMNFARFLLPAFALVGCVRGYNPPDIHDPHADVEIRIVHHSSPAPLFEEQTLIDGEAVSFAEEGGGTARTTVRVRPQPTAYDFVTNFYHYETRVVPQTYYETERYACGYHPRSGTQWCTRSVPRTRMVNVTTRVDDASCTTRMDQTPLAGAVYLVQYEFMANGVCRATCQRLLSGADGSLLATACGSGEPATTGSVPLASEWAADDAAEAESGTTDDGSFVSGTSGGEATSSGN
jgi:hypothetical protein